MYLKTYKQFELEALLEKEPNAYVAVVKVEAVRLETFLSSSRLGTEVPLRCIDQGQAYLENEARKGLRIVKRITVAKDLFKPLSA